jgi:uncharacterized surface protein with fasciclin (FAS1) repeats
MNWLAIPVLGCACVVSFGGFGTAGTAVYAWQHQPGATPGHGHHDHNHGDAKDINGLLEKTEEFSTLVGLLRQADLVNAIEEGGPYTVFAPTNEAFGTLPESTLENLSKPENKESLKKLLLGHVVKGKLKSTDLKTGELETLAGTKIKVVFEGGKITVGGVGIEHPDLDAENGVIHGLTGVIR